MILLHSYDQIIEMINYSKNIFEFDTFVNDFKIIRVFIKKEKVWWHIKLT